MSYLEKGKIKWENDFLNLYQKLCALHDLCPVQSIFKNIQYQKLDLVVDKLNISDWEPILKCLQINKNLNLISFRSCNLDKKSESRIPLKRRSAALNFPTFLTSLCKSTRACLFVNTKITLLEFKQIPLLSNHIEILSQGLRNTRSLQHLSFEDCLIGDAALIGLINCLQNVPYLITLNLTGCGLSDKGMPALVHLIKFQALQRHGAAWQASLRYQTPNFDGLGGVRRLTLSNNTSIGNAGSVLLAEAVCDDLWLKAIDLQNCGIGELGALAWLKVLVGEPQCFKENSFNSNLLPGNTVLTIVDLRRNVNIDRQLLQTITERVLLNSSGKQTMFNWLSATRKNNSQNRLVSWPGLSNAQHANLAPQKKRLSTFNENYHPKPLPSSAPIVRPEFRPGGGVLQRQSISVYCGRRVSKEFTNCIRNSNKLNHLLSAKNAVYKTKNIIFDSNRNNIITPGVPWRTAARATRHREKWVEEAPVGLNSLEGARTGRLRPVSAPPIHKQAISKMTEVKVGWSNNKYNSLKKKPRLTDLEREMSNECQSLEKNTNWYDTGRDTVKVSPIPQNSHNHTTLRDCNKINAQRNTKLTPQQILAQRLLNSKEANTERLKYQLKKHVMQVSRLEVKLNKERQQRLLESAKTPIETVDNKSELLSEAIYTRLDLTLTQVESLLAKYQNSKNSNLLASKNEEQKLKLLQSALRKLVAPSKKSCKSTSLYHTYSKFSNHPSATTGYSPMIKQNSKYSTCSTVSNHTPLQQGVRENGLLSSGSTGSHKKFNLKLNHDKLNNIPLHPREQIICALSPRRFSSCSISPNEGSFRGEGEAVPGRRSYVLLGESSTAPYSLTRKQKSPNYQKVNITTNGFPLNAYDKTLSTSPKESKINPTLQMNVKSPPASMYGNREYRTIKEVSLSRKKMNCPIDDKTVSLNSRNSAFLGNLEDQSSEYEDIFEDLLPEDMCDYDKNESKSVLKPLFNKFIPTDHQTRCSTNLDVYEDFDPVSDL